jgi:hypothetical protein
LISTANALVLFHCYSDRAIRRQANLIAFYLGDQTKVDIVVMERLMALAAVIFCQFNPIFFHPVDGTDVHAIGADDFHMLLDVGCVGHFQSP